MLTKCDFWSNGFLIGFTINGICFGLASALVFVEADLTLNHREAEYLTFKGFVYSIMSFVSLLVVLLTCK
ncbi:MAG: hypothetical protein N4J56_007292 [Chroococcidiopsis sp. SAG 2025]|nr:hypothetical protein [Chroococcidiopsis sp. SAG 2025]MDV2997587.1 hypothetical protein [Chroococcidiopsis sp. SAG 2025]